MSCQIDICKRNANSFILVHWWDIGKQLFSLGNKRSEKYLDATDIIPRRYMYNMDIPSFPYTSYKPTVNVCLYQNVFCLPSAYHINIQRPIMAHVQHYHHDFYYIFFT